MNIFYLDPDPVKCAQYHCDKHVVKMILESAQLLSSVHRLNRPQEDCDYEGIYKLTHKNHPSAVWTRESIANYELLFKIFKELCKEYKHRYNRLHLCELKLSEVLAPNKNILQRFDWISPDSSLTEIKTAMDWTYERDIYNQPYEGYSHQIKCPVHSYRNYYVQAKGNMLNYTKREVPKWIKDYT